MSLKDTAAKYGCLSQFFHWLVFILVLIMIPLGYVMGDVPNKAVSGQLFNIHKLIGISILILMILRLIWRLFNIKPPLPVGTPIWQRWAERGLHFLLYVGLIVMPLSGWIGTVSNGRPPHLGSLNIDLPIGKNKALADFFV